MNKVRDDYPWLNWMAGAGPSESARLEASRALAEIQDLRRWKETLRAVTQSLDAPNTIWPPCPSDEATA